MKILLCGFMGSGKTTLFERIKSSCPEVSCLDLDQLVEAELSEKGENLGDAIRRVGWEIFREKEKSLLNQELKKEGKLLISLGGGTLTPSLIEKIDSDASIKLVWLDTDFETCWSRVSQDKGRPLVAKGKEFLENLYNDRITMYSKASIHLSAEDQEKISLYQQLIQN